MGLTVVGAGDRNEESTSDNAGMNEAQPEQNAERGEMTNARNDKDGEDLKASYEESVSFHIDIISRTSVEALKTAIETVLVRNNGEFVSDYDKEYFAIAFPDLFSYGHGHPGTERIIPVSLEECCQYYARLHQRNFSQHPTFIFIAFDVCGRRRVATSTTVRARFRPGELESIGTVTKEEFAMALQRKRRRRLDALCGCSLQRVAEGERNRSKSELLLRHVTVSQRRMWGSNEERMTYRRKAFSIDCFFKTGALFVTITPSDIATMTVALFAGYMNSETMRMLEENQLPNRAQRLRIACRDPMACCEYFELVCEAFVEDIVGFNRRNRLPYAGVGLFGYVRAFIGVVEAQKSGTLHMYALLFIAVLPRTVKEFASKSGDVVNGDHFKERMCQLVDSVVCNTVPCSPKESDASRFPSCSTKGSL